MSSIVAALVSHYPAIITEIPTPFTAHQFIQSLTQQHQALYIDALYHYKDSAQPFQVVHGMLSKHLHEFEALVKYLGEVDSINIFGKSGKVSQWEKL